MSGTIVTSDYLDLLRSIPSESVHLVLTDPPYGVLHARWDVAPDLVAMFVEIRRILTRTGTAIVTGTQPFATDVINAGRDLFKYDIVIHKPSMPVGFLNAKNRPMVRHDNALIFSKGMVAHTDKSDRRMTYNPQMTKGLPYKRASHTVFKGDYAKWANAPAISVSASDGERYPSSVFTSNQGNHDSKHVSQKGLDIWLWLVRTYSNAGDTVLDPFVGSGTTAVACEIAGRDYICGDISPDCVALAHQRVKDEGILPMFGADAF